jgi:hypothetical protein
MERAPSMQDAEVDWDAVDPAAETSMRMALQLGAQLESAAALEERMENETAAALRVLRDYDDAARREEAEEDGDGMEAMGSMEHTLSETPEWDLNTILRRRTRRPDAPGTARLSDLDAEHDVADVRLEYLCFWVGRKGTAAQDQTLTSWESRLWLRDEGYSKQIDEVDRKAEPTRYHRPPQHTSSSHWNPTLSTLPSKSRRRTSEMIGGLHWNSSAPSAASVESPRPG